MILFFHKKIFITNNICICHKTEEDFKYIKKSLMECIVIETINIYNRIFNKITKKYDSSRYCLYTLVTKPSLRIPKNTKKDDKV